MEPFLASYKSFKKIKTAKACRDKCNKDNDCEYFKWKVVIFLIITRYHELILGQQKSQQASLLHSACSVQEKEEYCFWRKILCVLNKFNKRNKIEAIIYLKV